jgi:hypothetical protein
MRTFFRKSVRSTRSLSPRQADSICWNVGWWSTVSSCALICWSMRTIMPSRSSLFTFSTGCSSCPIASTKARSAAAIIAPFDSFADDS